MRSIGKTTFDISQFLHGFVANGPTSGFACVFARGPNSAVTPRAIAAVSLPAWKQVKSGRSRQARGPQSRTPDHSPLIVGRIYGASAACHVFFQPDILSRHFLGGEDIMKL